MSMSTNKDIIYRVDSTWIQQNIWLSYLPLKSIISLDMNLSAVRPGCIFLDFVGLQYSRESSALERKIQIEKPLIKFVNILGLTFVFE